MPDIQLNELIEVNPLRPTIDLNPTDEVSFIPMSDVSESGRWVNHQSRQFGDVSRGYTYFEEGDILFAKITPCMENGKGCYPKNLANGIGFASTEFHVIRAKDNADAGFMYQWSISKPLRLKASAIMTGSAGQQRVPASFLESFKVSAIAKPEQAKIAEILSTVDQAIAQTESLIAKQQRIKTGLMQDLLMCGIDENGNLRSEETHEFKDSPLGRIPVEWEVKEIQELLADVKPSIRSGPFGSALLKEELTESGIPFLGIDNVLPEEFVPFFKRFVAPKKARQLKQFRVRPRDVMITVMGTVGRCCMVPDDIGEALSSKHVWTLSFDEKAYSPYLACLQINHAPWVLNHFRKDVQGGIMEAIRSATLRSTPLPVPPLDEMREIESRLRAMSTGLGANHEVLRKLRRLKTALMQDLLTGKVSVALLLTDTEGSV